MLFCSLGFGQFIGGQVRESFHKAIIKAGISLTKYQVVLASGKMCWCLLLTRVLLIALS
jgi:hypothetical protein